MNVYFIRHGIAAPRGASGYKDGDRPLTKQGIDKMRRGAKGISRMIKSADAIISSPLKRAKETADIVARELKAEEPVETSGVLLHGCTPAELLRMLKKYETKKDVLLVGHEPDFSGIILALLGASTGALELKKGALCKMEVKNFAPGSHGKLLLLLQPKVLRELA